VADGAADDAAQHVAAPLVAGDHAVDDEEGTGADMVGDDLGFSIGTCGKDSQGVPVSDAMPTVRIPEMVVGGAHV